MIISEKNLGDVHQNPQPPQPKDASAGLFRPMGWVTAAVAASAVIAAAVSAIASFPVTEGWFETLIFLQKHGLTPYHDVQFVLPPVTIIYFHILTFFTHGNIAANKILGIGVAVVDAGLIFAWLKRSTSALAAGISATLAFLVVTVVPSYIAADYHDVDQGLLTITLMLLLAPAAFDVRRSLMMRGSIIAGAGVAAQFLFMTKQNIGLGVWGAYLVFMFGRAGFAVLRRQYGPLRDILAEFVLANAAFIAAGFATVWLAGVHQSYFHFVWSLMTVQSKGSPLYIATRLFFDGNNYTLMGPAAFLAIAIVLVTLAVQHVAAQNQISAAPNGSHVRLLADRIPKVYLISAGAVFAVLIFLLVVQHVIGVVTSSDTYVLWDLWPAILALTCFFLDIALTISTALGSKPIAPVSSNHALNYLRLMLFGAVIYANSLTAALSVVGLVVIFGYYAAFVLNYALQYMRKQQATWGRLVMVGCSIVLVIFAARLELSKFEVPYSWWGMDEPPVYASTTRVASAPLKGLLLDKDRAAMLSSIVQDIDTHTTPSDSILTYPDVPIFYDLSNRLPMTYTYVQWFDFSTTKALLSDFDRVAALPPKVIVQMSVPRAVYEGHENLLGKDLPQKAFSRYLSCMVDSKAFTVDEQFFYNRTTALQGTFVLRTENPMSASDVNAVATIVHNFSSESLVTGALGLGDATLTMSQMQMLPDQNARSFGAVVVTAPGEKMSGLVRYLMAKTGRNFSADDDNFILKVLLRQPRWKERGANCGPQMDNELRKFRT